MKTGSTILTAHEVVEDKILLIRGRKVMLDKDLAKLYGVRTVQTKKLGEQARCFGGGWD